MKAIRAANTVTTIASDRGMQKFIEQIENGDLKITDLDAETSAKYTKMQRAVSTLFNMTREDIGAGVLTPSEYPFVEKALGYKGDTTSFLQFMFGDAKGISGAIAREIERDFTRKAKDLAMNHGFLFEQQLYKDPK